MMTIPGFTIMLIWISICFSQLKLRPQYKEKPYFQVKWFPFTTIIALIGLMTIFISFMFNAQNKVGTSVSLIIIVILIALSFRHKK